MESHLSPSTVDFGSIDEREARAEAETARAARALSLNSRHLGCADLFVAIEVYQDAPTSITVFTFLAKAAAGNSTGANRAEGNADRARRRRDIVRKIEIV